MTRRRRPTKCVYSIRRTGKNKYFKCKSKRGNWSCKGNQCSRKLIAKMKRQCC